MAGIIEGSRAAQPTAGGGISAKALRSQMSLPPELQEPYARVVAAGKKILYSEQMAPQIVELLRGEGDMGQKLGQGVSALMGILVEKSNGTMPPQILIPAGIELVAEAGAMLKESGAPVTDADIAEGVAVLVETVLGQAGVTMDQLPQLLRGGGQPGAAPPQPGVAPAAGAQP
jgi:hypothetical protein